MLHRVNSGAFGVREQLKNNWNNYGITFASFSDYVYYCRYYYVQFIQAIMHSPGKSGSNVKSVDDAAARNEVGRVRSAGALAQYCKGMLPHLDLESANRDRNAS